MQKVKTRVLSVFMALTLALTMLVGMPLSAKAAPGEYNTGDIAVINSIIANNNLGWTTDDVADGNVIPANWTGVTWSGNSGDTNRRIVELLIDDTGLAGALNVTGLDALVYLDCSNNIGLTSLDASGLTNMLLLDCFDCNISTLNVSGCTGLLELWCWNNNLSALNLTGLTSLSHLVCSYNNLTALDVSGNTALVILECGENSLETLTLTGLASLEVLYCDRNNLTALNLSDNTALVELYCGGNSLTVLDVSALVDLEYLWCNYNYLSTLNVSNNTALVELSCQNNGLGVLDLTGLTNLEYLDCYENSLSTLTLTGLTNLEYLNCNNNNLTALDVSDCTSLIELYCSHNKLTALNLAGLTNLVTIYCVGNKISALTLTGFTELVALGCSYNNLTALDVTGLSKLNILICNNNFMSDPSMVTGVTTTNLPAINTNIGGVFQFNPQRVYVCEIGATKYETLDEAILAVPDGGATPTTIRLLVDITQNDVTYIDGKNVIFDLNGFDLIFANALYIGFGGTTGSTVDYTGTGTFAVVVEFDEDGDGYGFVALEVFGGSYIRIMYVEAYDMGDGINRWVTGVDCSQDSNVVIEGDVVVFSSGGVNCFAIGVEATGMGMTEGLAVITVNGNITTDGDGAWAYMDAIVTVNGDISVDIVGVQASRGGTVNVNGNISAGIAGVFAESDDEDARAVVNIDGSIVAGNIGVVALGNAEVNVIGNITVTETVYDPEGETIVVGVLAGYGAEVTVDGTITAINYIALYVEVVGEGYIEFVLVGPDGNVTPSSKSGYFEYNDSDADLITSYVWVKDPRTLTPGTGDSTTLWLLIGALMVAALGCGLVLAHKRREQEDVS